MPALRSNAGAPMKRVLRVLLALIAIVVIAAPLSVLGTLLLLPFWRWVEAATGIESIGHSGPAGWCYLATFLILAGGAALLLRLRVRGRPDRAAPL
jgi:TRAP-type C4-dicarboxylate transport system permease small subunit